MKPREVTRVTRSIKVELTVIYHPYTTRPEACSDRCPQFKQINSAAICTVYGPLQLQRGPGSLRYTRAAACIEAERPTVK